ncbi:MAG: RNA polymerase sigma factor [Sphingobacteriales bacterium]|jgi:RNA polymerase sigma-70 factor (ECF subfamily)|nr:MAG: RNA polymerase sigma factor [Sphingobacteriales bacterium]
MKEVSFSDEQLIQLYVLGNKNAISILYNRYSKKVILYIYFKIRDRQQAEDIFHESFIKMVKYIDEGKYINNGKMYNLLIRISRNTCIDYIRSKNIKPIIVDIEVAKGLKYEINDINISEINRNEIFVERVIRLLDLLPKDEREIVILKHYAGLTFKEIADTLDMNINTALSRMRSALKRLKYHAEQRGLEPPK